MESFQQKAPATGWNDLPSNISPNLRFGGSKKRYNRNNLYKQYNSNGSIYSYSSSNNSQDYGLNNPQQPMMQTPPMMGPGNNFNKELPQPPMSSIPQPSPMMATTSNSSSSQNSLNNVLAYNQSPHILGNQTPNPYSQLPPPPTSSQLPPQSQQPPSQLQNQQPYYNPISNIPTPTYNSTPATNMTNPNTYTPPFQTQPTQPLAQQQQPLQNYGVPNPVANSIPSANTPVSNDLKNSIIQIFNQYLEKYQSSCSLFQRRMYEDTHSRINQMYEQLNNNMIDEQSVQLLNVIAKALETRDSATANSNLSVLMKNASDKNWTLGVKGLVDFFFNH